MNSIKEMIANAEASRPYWIDTAVYFSPDLARAKNSTHWAAGTYAMPQLPGMTCTTAAGFYRYTPDEVPADTVEDFKATRLAILAQHGIPVKATTKAKSDKLPTVAEYGDYLTAAQSKFGITRDQARDLYGKLTKARWEKLLNDPTVGIVARRYEERKAKAAAEATQPKVFYAENSAVKRRRAIAPANGKPSQLSFGF